MIEVRTIPGQDGYVLTWMEKRRGGQWQRRAKLLTREEGQRILGDGSHFSEVLRIGG